MSPLQAGSKLTTGLSCTPAHPTAPFSPWKAGPALPEAAPSYLSLSALKAQACYFTASPPCAQSRPGTTRAWPGTMRMPPPKRSLLWGKSTWHDAANRSSRKPGTQPQCSRCTPQRLSWDVSPLPTDRRSFTKPPQVPTVAVSNSCCQKVTVEKKTFRNVQDPAKKTLINTSFGWMQSMPQGPTEKHMRENRILLYPLSTETFCKAANHVCRAQESRGSQHGRNSKGRFGQYRRL